MDKYIVSACEGKEKFRDKILALSVVNRRPKKSSNSLNLKVYLCDNCKHWHIGTRTKSYAQERRRHESIRS